MANPDLDELLNTLFPFAEQMLAKHGEFYPFGARMEKDGTIAHVAAHTGDEHSPSQEVIDLLARGFRDEALQGKVRAVGICFDVRVIPPNQADETDAVCARLEHENGEAVQVFLPYHKSRLGKYKFGELFASRGEHEIFERPEGAV